MRFSKIIESSTLLTMLFTGCGSTSQKVIIPKPIKTKVTYCNVSKTYKQALAIVIKKLTLIEQENKKQDIKHEQLMKRVSSDNNKLKTYNKKVEEEILLIKNREQLIAKENKILSPDADSAILDFIKNSKNEYKDSTK